MKRKTTKIKARSFRGQVKARKMYGRFTVGADSIKLYRFAVLDSERMFYFLDLSTPKDYDAMVEQMARAICKQLKEPARVRWTKWGEESRAALAAIGVTRPKDNQ